MLVVRGLRLAIPYGDHLKVDLEDLSRDESNVGPGDRGLLIGERG